MRRLAAGIAVGAAITFGGGAASAEPVECGAGYPDNCVEVQPVTLDPSDVVTQVDVQSPSVPQTPAVQQQAQLPVTGGDAATLAGVGALLLAGGFVLVRRSGADELPN